MAKSNYKKIETITRKIEQAKKDNPNLLINFEIDDSTSTQAELRLTVTGTIDLLVDKIKYPRRLTSQYHESPWAKMDAIETQIEKNSKIHIMQDQHTAKINLRTKNGAADRATNTTHISLMWGNQFLAAIAAAKKEVVRLNKIISGLQAGQKKLIAEMRALNSAKMLADKNIKRAEREANEQAIKSGEFWEASVEALKEYFAPPFEKNYLADVSEKWRAALFLEMKSEGYKSYNGWRHKLVATGGGYLCGIDDNGDEWGYKVELNEYLSYDEYYDLKPDATVEGVMSALFWEGDLSGAERQGDLLFVPTSLPAEATPLHPHHGEWVVRGSHTITSADLQRNGRYFSSSNEITITHTSHAPIVLRPGTYRLYALSAGVIRGLI